MTRSLRSLVVLGLILVASATWGSVEIGASAGATSPTADWHPAGVVPDASAPAALGQYVPLISCGSARELQRRWNSRRIRRKRG